MLFLVKTGPTNFIFLFQQFGFVVTKAFSIYVIPSEGVGVRRNVNQKRPF